MDITVRLMCLAFVVVTTLAAILFGFDLFGFSFWGWVTGTTELLKLSNSKALMVIGAPLLVIVIMIIYYKIVLITMGLLIVRIFLHHENSFYRKLVSWLPMIMTVMVFGGLILFRMFSGTAEDCVPSTDRFLLYPLVTFTLALVIMFNKSKLYEKSNP